MSSACEVLQDEPDRFLDFMLSNRKLRTQIYDEQSFEQALTKTLLSDPSLSEIVSQIKGSGESVGICGQIIFNSDTIQNMIKNNLKSKKDEIKKRISKQKPSLKGKQLKKEIDRRLNISIGVSKSISIKSKQLSINDAVRPIKVSQYQRQGQLVKKSTRRKPRALLREEKDFFINSIKSGKLPSQTYNEYFNAGFQFRSKPSIRTYYYRIKRQLNL